MDLSEYMSDDLKEKLVGQDMCDVDGQRLAYPVMRGKKPESSIANLC